jgi:hypothetical protein
MMSRMWASFFAGVLVVSSIHMCIQDWMGLERYIMHVRTGWIETPGWLSIIGILLGVAWQGYNLWKDDEDRNG